MKRDVFLKVILFMIGLSLMANCGLFKNAPQSPTDDWEEKIDQSPWLITGDYFRQQAKQESKKPLISRPASHQHYLRRKVLICCFLPQGRCQKWNLLGRQLECSHKVIVVGHKDLVPVLTKFNFSKRDLLKSEVRDKIGNLIGLQAFLFLKSSKNGQVSLEVYDNQGVMLTKFVFNEGQDFQRLSSKIADYIYNHTCWEGRIAYIENDRVYLNVGRLSGLKEGQVLAVYAQGRKIVNPVTGVSLGYLAKKKGEIKVVSFFGENAAVAKIIAGTGFQINDIVRIEGEK